MALTQNRTLKELVAPTLDQQLLCIAYPPLEVAFELKSSMIHLLPKFHGFLGKDPNKHFKKFHVVWSSMKPHGITKEQVKIRAFMSLKDSVNEWLYYLPWGTINTCVEMKRYFLKRYFPSSKVIKIKKQICAIRQEVMEPLYEYWNTLKGFVRYVDTIR